jgi:hypothetical protein
LRFNAFMSLTHQTLRHKGPLGRVPYARKLLVWCAILWTVPETALTQILLPPPPRVLPPPQSEDSGRELEEQTRQKREEREKRERELRPPPPSPTEKRNQQLLEETLKPRPTRVVMEVSVVLPRIVARDPGRDYLADVTSHFQVFWRPSNSEASAWQFWTGLRAASFAGSGWQNNVPGRFGFFYFGPMVAVGKFSLVPKDRGEAEDSWFARHGTILSAGISAQSRIGRPWGDAPGEDFTTKGVGFDPPGAWIEARWITVHFGGLGLSGFVGAQAGRNKQFLWTGVGFSGLH